MIATKVHSLKRNRHVAHPTRSSSIPRWARRTAWILGTVILVCVVLDFVASPIVRSVVNSRFEKMPEFTGHVDKMNVSIWRGRCEAEGFVFQKRGDPNPPLARVKSGVVNISYSALLTGRLHARITVDQLDAALLKTEPSPPKKDKKEPPAPAKTERWREMLHKSFPMEITRFEVKNSRLMFIDRTHEQPVQIGLLQFHVLATDLGTKPGKDGELPAKIVAEGVTSGHGNLTLRIQADPAAETPRFHVQFAVTNVNLPELNDFLLAFAKIDVARGTFEFESEVTAKGGGYEGYVKPFFKDLDFKTASDENKTAVQLLTKKAVAAVTQIFKNKAENKVATKAPISGNFEKNDVDVWTTISNLMRNAFVQAIREGFEGQTPTR